jgi:CRISPR-associated RAMP protein (TIGR02581 family)
MSNYVLQNRYRFRGTLEMQTALHIGGGRVTRSNSDSPVVLTPEGAPFIPGSSFKGALRSTVEKFVPLLPGNLSTCALMEPGEEEREEARKQGRKLCSTTRQQEIARERRENPAPEQVEAILAQARKDCCDTCKLFGSPFAASRVSVKDLYVLEKVWSDRVEIRDGVAIDRDSEKAKDRLKYDYEVVPASTAFALEITLENAALADVQLICVGLSEFVSGSGTIGGKRSRGLGACILNNLSVASLDLTDEKTRDTNLHDYLLKRAYPQEEKAEMFLDRHISRLFQKS